MKQPVVMISTEGYRKDDVDVASVSVKCGLIIQNKLEV